MKQKIDILKGISPGKYIEYELKKSNKSQRDLANSSGVPFQTISNIIAGERGISIGNALKIEKELGFEEGFLSVLQTYFDIEKHKSKATDKSEKPNIRRVIFWDTDFDSIDWQKQKNAIIQRVMERGNSDDKNEIARFYNISLENIEEMSKN